MASLFRDLAAGPYYFSFYPQGLIHFDNQLGRLVEYDLDDDRTDRFPAGAGMDLEIGTSNTISITEGTSPEMPLELLVRGRAAAESLKADDDTEVQKCRDLIEAGKLGDAEQLAWKIVSQAGVKAMAALRGDDRPDATGVNRRMAEALLLLGDVLVLRGRYSTAEIIYLNALRYQRRIAPQPLPAIATIHERVARVQMMQQSYQESERSFQKALTVYQQMSDRSGSTAGLVATLVGSAEMYCQYGRLEEAERRLRLAQQQLQSAPQSDPEALASVLLTLGHVAEDRKRGSEAESLYRQVVNLQTTGNSSSATGARALAALGDLYRDGGRNAEANQCYQQALQKFDEARNGAIGEAARCTLARVDVLLELGLEKEAAKLIEQTLSGPSKSDLPPGVVGIAHDLQAQMAWRQGRRQEAFDSLAQAIECARRQRAETAGAGRSRAEFFGEFAGTFQRMILWQAEAGNLAEAHAAVEQTRARLLLDDLSWRGVQLLAGTANTDLDIGDDLSDAVALGPWIITDWKMLNQPSNARFFEPSFERVIVNGRRREARRKVKFIEEILLLPPAERMRQMQQMERWRLARDASSATRYATGYDREAEEEDTKAVRKSNHWREYGKRSSDSLRAEIAKLQEEARSDTDTLNASLREARRKAPVFWWNIAKKWEPLGWDPLQQWVTEQNVLLLQYVLTSEQGLLFTIAPDTKPRVETLRITPQQAELLGGADGPLTRARAMAILGGDDGLLAQLSDPALASQAAGQLKALFGLLIPEHARQMLLTADIDRVVIVPDGPLAMLPFEALVVKEDLNPVYLLDVGPPIVYGHSATLVQRLSQRSPAPLDPRRAPVLIVADPAYKGAAASLRPTEAFEISQVAPQVRFAEVGGTLPQLQHSMQEATWVRHWFDDCGLTGLSLTGHQATEANARSQVPGRHIVLFSCHGLADQREANPFAALALTPKGPTETSRSAGNNGFLTLDEICDLNLHGCELAILSACRTNYGPEQRGEGVWGLSRAFSVAGARRVMASNWLVDDQAAAHLASYLANLLSRQVTAAGGTNNLHQLHYASAMQKAKLLIRKQPKWQSPYYWAPMVLIGPN